MEVKAVSLHRNRGAEISEKSRITGEIVNGKIVLKIHTEGSVRSVRLANGELIDDNRPTTQ